MKQKILIVEDNKAIMALTEAILKNDFEVYCAMNASEALDIIKKTSIDLAILDIMLPDMSGLELCSLIKSNPKYEDIHIIFLTSKSGSDSRIIGYHMGAIHYLEKPFEPRELLLIIKNVLGNLAQDTRFEMGNIKIDFIKQIAFVDDLEIKLTKTEFKILSYLAINFERVISKENMLENALKSANKKSRSIEAHISSLRKKLSTCHLEIENVYGEGYKLKQV